MKVKYILNTCDIDNWNDGEQVVAFVGDKVLFGHDHSDEFLNIEDSRDAQREIQKKLKTKEEITYEQVSAQDVSPKLVEAIRKFFNF